MRLIGRNGLTRHLCCLLAYVLLFQDVTAALAQTAPRAPVQPATLLADKPAMNLAGKPATPPAGKLGPTAARDKPPPIVLAQGGPPPSGPPQLTQARLGATLQVLSGEGKLLISGGRETLTSPPLASAEVYDPSSNTIQPLPSSMLHGRAHFASSTLATGEILLGAGENLNGRLSEFELHVPSLGQFVASPLRLDAPRSGHTQTVASDGRTILIAGTNGSGAPTGAIHIVDARAGTITVSAARLATPRSHHAAVLDPASGHIVVLGGRDSAGQPLGTAERYDPATDQMVNAAINLLTPRSNAVALVRPDGKAWLLGGYGPNDVVLKSTEIVDLTSGQVVPGAPLPTPRAGAVGALVGAGRTVLAGGTADGATALASLDLLPAELDQTPPRLVAASPAPGATGVPTDSILSLRFSEPLRPATATSATLVLSSPTERLETTVTLAEGGLLLFVVPKAPLAPETEHTLAASGVTDLAGNPLGPVTLRFQTAPGGGEGPRITAFSPTAGAEGDEIKVTGQNFGGATRVAVGGIAAGQFTVSSPVQITAVVPRGALTGPLSVTTPAGTGTSQGHFIVLSNPNFALRVSPDRGAETIAGDQYTFALNVVASGGFLGNVRLGVSGLPAHLKATFDKPVLAPVGYAYLTLEAAERLRPGQYHITITGTATLGSQDVTRTVAATLRVHPPAGTSLSGRVVRLDDVPVPNYTVRVGNQRTTSDAAGNFLLKHLHLPKPQKKDDLVLVLDGRTARLPGIDYPIYEQLLEYDELVPNKPNRVNYGHPIWIFTLDPSNAIQVQPEAPQERTYKFAHIPGLEITVPAGTTFKDIDGNPTTTINAARIPLSRPHLHDFPKGLTPGAIFSLQLGGTTASKPLQVTMPNPTNLPPGTRVGFWFYDIHRAGWFNPGQGTVSPDGQKIVPDPGVGVTRLHCFLETPPEFTGPVCVECAQDGVDKVDVTSGTLVHSMTDVVIPGRLPVVFTRIYRSRATRSGPFGFGWSHNFELQLGLLPTDHSSFQVVLPTDTRLNFLSSEGFEHRGTPVYWGARYSQVSDPLFEYQVVLKDGTVWGFRKHPEVAALAYLVALRDRHGNTLTIRRPDYIHPTQITTPDGRTLAIEYDGQNRITKLTGPLEQTVTYEYNGDGDLWKVTDPMGGVTRYTYQNHNLTSIQTPRGENPPKFRNTYDPAEPDPTKKRVTEQRQADGGLWQFSYQTIGTQVTQTTVTDPRGKTRTYDIESGYIAAITNHLGQRTTFTRPDSTHLITRIQDHLQRRTNITYDSRKNVQTITQFKDPPNYTQPVTHTFAYDLDPTHFGLLMTYTDPLMHTWTFGLSADFKNVTSVRNPAPISQTWTITPTSAGQVQQITDPLGHATDFTYNSYGLLETVTTHPDGSTNLTTTYTYDPLGRRIAATDPRGFTTRFAYDLLNRLTAVANPLGQAVQFAYDPNSNLTSVKDPRNGEIVYTYDPMDRLATRRDQLLRSEVYTYDAQGGGTLVSFRDRKNQETTWDPYDDLNRPTVVRFHNSAGTEVGTLTYRYDAANRLDQLTDSVAGAITWLYDPLDRLTRETTPQGMIDYVPDDANRRTSMLVAGQPLVEYQWDNANRLTQITRDTLSASYGYDTANRRTSLTLPNQVAIAYGFDDADRLTSLTYTGPGGPLGNLTYAYDRGSNRTLMAGSWARTLLPDPVSGGSYDAANRQTALGAKTMTYDFNGNLETLTEAAQTTTYTWDARDRLTGLSGPGLTASFAYDGTNRRTQKTIDGFSATFFYDGSDIIKEVAGGSEVSYLRDLDIDEPLARIEPGGTSCYLADSIGSLLAMSSSEGGIATEYTYEPFGRTIATGATSQNSFQFTGRENDGTGLYYYRARYYDPRLGRFLREDPIGLQAGDTNLYAYVGNNSVNYTDPFGLIKGVHTDRPLSNPSERFIDYEGYRFNQNGQLVDHNGKVIGEPKGKAKRIRDWLVRKKPSFFRGIKYIAKLGIVLGLVCDLFVDVAEAGETPEELEEFVRNQRDASQRQRAPYGSMNPSSGNVGADPPNSVP